MFLRPVLAPYFARRATPTAPAIASSSPPVPSRWSHLFPSILGAGVVLLGMDQFNEYEKLKSWDAIHGQLKYLENKTNSKIFVIGDGISESIPSLPFWKKHTYSRRLFSFSSSDAFASHFERQTRTDSPDVQILIHSHGGSSSGATSICQTITEYGADDRTMGAKGAKTTAIVPFRAHSAGAMVALACQHLHMHPLATVSPIDTQIKSPHPQWAFPIPVFWSSNVLQNSSQKEVAKTAEIQHRATIEWFEAHKIPSRAMKHAFTSGAIPHESLFGVRQLRNWNFAPLEVRSQSEMQPYIDVVLDLDEHLRKYGEKTEAGWLTSLRNLGTFL